MLRAIHAARAGKSGRGPTPRASQAAIVIAALGLAVLSLGCQTQRSGSAGGGPAGAAGNPPSGSARSGQAPANSGDYVSLYDSGQYQAAFDAASRVAAGPRSVAQRWEASLVAGLSAQAINRDDDAKRFLSPLVQNPDPNLGGRATAALGLIAREEGRHADAAELLMSAGQKLSGDDGARASMLAGDSYRTLGKPTDAMIAYRRAQDRGPVDPQLRQSIADRIRSGGQPPRPQTVITSGTPASATAQTGRFTVQAGAFTSQARAQQRAAQVGAAGSARVVPIRGARGQRLWAVRIGRFETRPEADAVRARVGRDAIVRVVTDE